MPSRRRNAPSVPASLHRSASASNRRFSLPENLRRLAIATTSGSRRAASGETVSPVALRAPSATASPEEPDNPFKEDLNNEVMCMSYLYSKLPETGVPLLIGTGGAVAVARGALVASYAVEERIEKHRNQRGQQNAGFKQGPNVMGQIAKVGRDILRSAVIRQT